MQGKSETGSRALLNILRRYNRRLVCVADSRFMFTLRRTRSVRMVRHLSARISEGKA